MYSREPSLGSQSHSWISSMCVCARVPFVYKTSVYMCVQTYVHIVIYTCICVVMNVCVCTHRLVTPYAGYSSAPFLKPLQVSVDYLHMCVCMYVRRETGHAQAHDTNHTTQHATRRTPQTTTRRNTPRTSKRSKVARRRCVPLVYVCVSRVKGALQLPSDCHM